jgi:UDP-N-acetylmuramate--L-alanine ligase/UDP-N-acetylenolpyruvoylglucosamine reductase
MAFSLAQFPAASTHVHLIGVAGSGMSGLAWLFLQLGYRVSGCDKVTSAETERLIAAGLEFHCPQTAESVRGADVVVYTSAVKPGNPAYDAAVAAGVVLWRRAEALAAVMHGKKGIVVCGTHGKTTTSAMTAHVLREAGLHPSHYVGAEIPLLGANAGWDPEGAHFVAEGDESDGTLVHFHPEHAIVLNIEEEHLDHYADLDAILRVFGTVLGQTASTVYYCADDAGARRACAGRADAVSFGFSESADVRAVDLVSLGQSSTCTVLHRGRPLGELVLNIPGRHNVSNALAAVALATDRGVSFEKIRSALEGFRGAKRRFEVRYRSDAYRIVDDYGHHPSEIAATLAAARALQPGRLVVVFQPHRYTRTQLLKDQFGPAFAAADAVFVTDVYAASEPPIPGIGGQTIIEAINASAPSVATFSTPKVATAHLAVGNFLRPGDLLVTLGAGNVHEVGTRLSAALRTLEEMAAALQGETRGGSEEASAVVRLYEPMSRHTTMLIGGPADYWIEPRTVAGFQRLVRHLRDRGIPIRVIGRGSNLLVRDGGIRGAVIHPAKGEFAEVRVVAPDSLEAGVGARFQKLAMTARAAGIGGFEWMEGIPGNVGGGLRMNAGAMGVQTFDQVVSVRLLDSLGELRVKNREELTAYYRHVPELATHYAVSAVFRGTPTPVERIDAGLAESKQKRRTSQPVAASAGCIFKNPEACPAGKLIDELGLKNTTVGRARISPVHGNFMVNEGGATAADVLALIDMVKRAARDQRGIELETEVQILGEDG